MDMFLTLSLIQEFFLIPSDFLLFVTPNFLQGIFTHLMLFLGVMEEFPLHPGTYLVDACKSFEKSNLSQCFVIFFLSLQVTNTA